MSDHAPVLRGLFDFRDAIMLSTLLRNSNLFCVSAVRRNTAQVYVVRGINRNEHVSRIRNSRGFQISRQPRVRWFAQLTAYSLPPPPPPVHTRTHTQMAENVKKYCGSDDVMMQCLSSSSWSKPLDEYRAPNNLSSWSKQCNHYNYFLDYGDKLHHGPLCSCFNVVVNSYL